MESGRVQVCSETRWIILRALMGRAWYIFKNKTPLYAEDTWDTLPQDKPTVRAEAVKEGVRASAYLPLISKGNCIGILYVDLTTLHRFSEENEKQVLELFAAQAAIAIENARLYRQEKTTREAAEVAYRELQQAQQEKLAMERVIEANRLGMEFADRLNNIAGTIPLRAKQAQELLRTPTMCNKLKLYH